MPILLHVNELEPGMCLASNIVNRFNILLAHGRKLNENDIKALQRKFPDLTVQIIDPVLDQVVEFEDTLKDQKISQEVRHNVATIVNKVSKNITSGLALESENISGIQKVIEEMVQYLQDNPVTMAIIEQSHSWDEYLQEHCANVFYLSLVIGNTIRNYIKQERERLSAAKNLQNGMNITPMAMAAMFHDIGMVPLEKLFQKTEPLTAEEIEQVKAHPVTGAAMLPEQIDPMVKLIIRQHHENQDGSGYPDELTGDQTNIFARIMRIADAYTAGVSTRIYQKAKSPHFVLYEMLHGRYRQFYDPMVLKIFASVIQPFQVGAKLTLENGKTAVIVRYNRLNPFNPEIIVAFDEWGDPLSKDDLDGPFYLNDRVDVRVATFGNEDVSYINAAAVDEIPVEPALQQISRTYSDMFELAYP
jgi:HD-GYP domain-containing protein (c-di-GMP phosphodiesterase class II)